MKTRRPFSTISYNTTKFLKFKLDEMILHGKIDFYAFIEHLPEDDETKVHKHLYVEPCGEINTASFCDELIEPDLSNDLPLKCIRCVPSKFDDWYMYSLHDKDYLASKLESRKYNYTDDDLVVSDTDVLKELIHTADFTKYKAFKKFRDLVLDGKTTFRDIFKNGFVPVQQINQYERAFYLIKGEPMPDRTFRGCHRGHETIVDTETGEVVAEQLGSYDNSKYINL